MQEAILIAPILPVMTCAALLASYRGFYRRLADPTAQFRVSRRPRILRLALVGILIFGAIIYPTILVLRVQLITTFLSHVLGIDDWIAWAGLTIFVGTLLCEFIVVSHLLFYLKLCYDGASRYRIPTIPPLPERRPKVALLIPACDEAPETLARPLGSLHHIQYPECRVILVENSRDPAVKRASLALADRHGVEALDLVNRGTKAAALNDALASLDADTEYICVLDADQRIDGDLISDLVALLEVDAAAGWIQTPQTYDLVEQSSLLAAAATQQIITLFDSSIQGKDVRGMCPLLGTGYLLRFTAINSVGGWDESYVNEDTPTAYGMQLKGWTGRYLQRLYTSGIVPPTLQALWGQQARWSHSNSKLAFTIMRGFFDSTRRPAKIVADYLSFVSYELLTFLIAALALVPTAYLLGSFFLLDNVDAVSGALDETQWAFASLYPFYVILLFFPHVNVGLRGYPWRNIMLAQGLNTCLGSAYARGVRRALFGEPVIFESAQRFGNPVNATNKWSSLWSPQVLGLGIFLSAAGGSAAVAFQYPGSPFPWIVMFWSAYNAFCVGHYVLFAIEEMSRTRDSQGQPTPRVLQNAGADEPELLRWRRVRLGSSSVARSQAATPLKTKTPPA